MELKEDMPLSAAKIEDECTKTNVFYLLLPSSIFFYLLLSPSIFFYLLLSSSTSFYLLSSKITMQN